MDEQSNSKKTAFLKDITDNPIGSIQTAILLALKEQTIILDNIQRTRFLLLTVGQVLICCLRKLRKSHWANDKVGLVGESRIKTQIIQQQIPLDK